MGGKQRNSVVPLHCSLDFSGVLTWPDGRQYRGAFKRAEIEGLGELFMNSKKNDSSDLSASQSGASLVNSIFYSHSKDVTDSCSCLKGRFRKGRLNGLGTAMFVCNSSGSFVHPVCCRFLNGDSYEGYWTNGMMNGYGVLRTNDRLYVGAFKDNQKHGYGVLSSTREFHFIALLIHSFQLKASVTSANGRTDNRRARAH